ncbi:MAG TPA: hypothetical protein VMH83_08090 [Candidatus Acidoferrum sp.]|nr:hypothetical protein [Candidatus Acidoferrum sp.]
MPINLGNEVVQVGVGLACVNGMQRTNSGYTHLSVAPGNVMPAFSVEDK